MLVIVIAALFALVFARALVAYLRSRDSLQGAVTLVFTAVAALFLLYVWRYLFGEPPRLLRFASLLLLFGQPFFTLRLVTLIRPLSGYTLWVAGAGWLASIAAILVFKAPLPPPALAGVVGYFVLTESIAAAYFAAEARRRTGAPRVRLGAAAAATALFAAAMLVLGVTSFAPGAASGLSTGARIVALGSAIGYVMAFVPPGWLRRLWSARAAYTMMGRLLRAPGAGSPEQTWQQYAETVITVADADAAIVAALNDAGEPRRIAAAGPALADHDPTPEELILLVSEAGSRGTKSGRIPWLPGSARRRGPGRVVTTVPLRLHAEGPGLLLVLGRHRSLFTEDDVTLLADLGRQATVLADRAVLTAQLTNTVDALRAANHAKNDFVAAMSHELRTPLNAIIGFSELMGFEDRVDDRRLVPCEWIDNVHSSGRHLLGLINDVLDLAKVESGRIELRREPLDIGTAVAEAVAPLRSLLDAKQLRLTIAVPPVVVQADRMRLRQMLNNLLSNAIKFTPALGSIYVSAHRDGMQAHLTVADTGPGIEPADQERVFEEFHQSGDAESRSAGTGLGLTLTRRLAEAHDGRVELRSQPGHGSRFSLVLPAVDPEPTVAVVPTPEVATERRGGVLLVEDEPTAASLLQTYLAGAGYPVHVAGTGEEGLAAAARYAPDVILLDVLLPGMDGWTVLQQLKADERLRHIPVVVVTVVDEREVGLALGAVDYFVKPVERSALLAWLARHGLFPPLVEGPPTVLAVDPNPTTLDFVRRCLHQEGLNVLTASTGSDALRLIREGRIDLVMCDHLVPDVSGSTFLSVLRDDPTTRELPVVVVADTALTESEKARLPGNILGVVSRDQLEPHQLQQWLARVMRPLVPGAGPPLEKVTA